MRGNSQLKKHILNVKFARCQWLAHRVLLLNHGLLFSNCNEVYLLIGAHRVALLLISDPRLGRWGRFTLLFLLTKLRVLILILLQVFSVSFLTFDRGKVTLKNVCCWLASKNQGLLLIISLWLVRNASELLNLGHTLLFLLKNVVSVTGHTVRHWRVSDTLVNPCFLSLWRW